jgi:Kef-type K+ transport system membrane component KefB
LSLSVVQVSILLTSIAVILVAAHALAQAFTRFRQPAVIGEVVGGLVLGPTVLGILSPRIEATLFTNPGPVPVVLGALSQLGLLLLMFVTGSEIQLRTSRRERRTVAWVAGLGLAVPFGVGCLVVLPLKYGHYSGPRGTPATFTLVFGIAVAVTSIPVISRLMLDLRLLGTGFARVVLSVAMIEDVALYGVLALTLSLGGAAPASDIGIWALIGTDSMMFNVTYHLLAALVFVVVALLWGVPLLSRLMASPANLVGSRSPAALRLTLLLVAALLCTVIGINPIFGALLAGYCLRRADEAAPRTAPVSWPEDTGRTWESIHQFSVAFFVPIYFVSVGLKLDLLRHFDPVFFAWFLVLCCAVKAVSIWSGARIAGQNAARAVDLAVALNARGGPGIVLATVCLDAKIININFYTSIVLLSIITSQLAGFWLDRRRAVLASDAPASPGPTTVPVAAPAPIPVPAPVSAPTVSASTPVSAPAPAPPGTASRLAEPA